MTDFDRVRRLGGTDETFPGVRAYLFGSLERLNPALGSARDDGSAMRAWITAFRAEAAAHGMTVDVRGGLVYLTWPLAGGAS